MISNIKHRERYTLINYLSFFVNINSDIIIRRLQKRNWQQVVYSAKMQENSEPSVNYLSDQTPILSSEAQPELDSILPITDQVEQNKLDIKNRKKSQKQSIKISVDECRKQQKQASIAKQCRICLDGQEEGRMIKPCQCSGSISYVHEKCIIEWIKRKHDVKGGSKNKPSCQMCSTPFHYKYGKKKTLSMEQFCTNYNKQRCNFVLFYLLASFLTLAIIGLIVIISESDKQTELGVTIKNTLVKSENIKIIYICVIFILMIVLMFLLILFVIQYAVKSELIISEVVGYLEVGMNKRCRIFPKTLEEVRRRNNPSTSIF